MERKYKTPRRDRCHRARPTSYGSCVGSQPPGQAGLGGRTCEDQGPSFAYILGNTTEANVVSVALYFSFPFHIRSFMFHSSLMGFHTFTDYQNIWKGMDNQQRRPLSFLQFSNNVFKYMKIWKRYGRHIRIYWYIRPHVQIWKYVLEWAIGRLQL